MLKLLSLFSGIGAFEKALDNIGVEYQLVNYCEIDKYASKSYSAIHNVSEDLNLWDVTKVDTSKLPQDIDLTVYGFPCQDISSAGNMRGLFNEDGTQTRSGLFFEALRIIEDTRPKIAIAENVKNLVNKTFKNEFEIVLKSLDEAGYNNYWKVLNAKDYGIPQNRERVFIVSIRKDIDNGNFEFPKPFELKLRLKDMLEDEVEVDEKYYLSEAMKNYLFTITEKNIERNNGNRYKAADLNGVSKAITTKEGGRVKDNFIEYPQVKQIGNIVDDTNIKFKNPQRGRVYDKNGISPSLNTVPGGGLEPKIITHNIPEIVKVRKYTVNTVALQKCLRDGKNSTRLSNKYLAEELNVPITTVEHWFRTDDCFSIPDADIWLQLKELLHIETDVFDKSIMTFEEREGIFEKSNRVYDVDGISATLTRTDADIKIKETESPTIRKLTPKECFRLMGFSDSDFAKCKDALNQTFYKGKDKSNSQMYKLAGNSIVVKVLEELFRAIFLGV